MCELYSLYSTKYSDLFQLWISRSSADANGDSSELGEANANDHYRSEQKSGPRDARSTTHGIHYDSEVITRAH